MKSLWRQLACQASLSVQGPCLFKCSPPVDSGDNEQTSVDTRPCGNISWGSQVDLAALVSPIEDILKLDYENDDQDTSVLLISDEDRMRSLHPFYSGYRACHCECLPGQGPAPSGDMHSMCRHTTSMLNIPWPAAVTEKRRNYPRLQGQ